MDLSNNFLSGTIPHCFGRVSSDDPPFAVFAIEFSKKMLMCLFWEFFMIISTKLYLVINITHKMNLISLQNTGVALIRDPFLHTCLVWISLAIT